MLYLATRGRRLFRAHLLLGYHPPKPAVLCCIMYTTRLYTSGGGSGTKPGRRGAMLEVPHPSHMPPHPAYALYPGRHDSHREAHFHYHAHLSSPHMTPLTPHYMQQAHFQTYGGGVSAGGQSAPVGRKKAWTFIQEKMSYDTFFTMKRLIERSRRPDEVLRWLTQNPAKISHNHYPVALQRIGQLLQGSHASQTARDLKTSGAASSSDGRQILEQQDFQTLCCAIVQDCAKFDNFSIVNCLYAVATLGLPGDSQVVQVLEAESKSRLDQFNQKDLSMVFSSIMKLHPQTQHPLTEACLSGLERNLERECHPQTLFLLLSYYKFKWRALQEPPDPAGGDATCTSTQSPELLTINRKILRLVKHILASVPAVRDQELVLLDEMLAACVSEASNKSLESIFSSQIFYQNRQERFISSLAGELPRKLDVITPFTVALIAKYVARHRLRETRLLDAIADFVVKRAEALDSKVIQKLVFPFSRMSYHPANHKQFFSRLEEVVDLKALSSPLATVNILMSLFQLGHVPGPVLPRVFCPTFISNVTNSPYALIARRYLSLLDAAVSLEYPEYTGPRLQDDHKVVMFDHILTADEVNRKYSYKGLVSEALRQLLGEQNFMQDQILEPGYHTDFLLMLDGSGRVLPLHRCTTLPKPPDDIISITSDFQNFDPFSSLEDGGGAESFSQGEAGNDPVTTNPPLAPAGPPRSGIDGGPLVFGSYYATPSEFYSGLVKENSMESQDSSLSSATSENHSSSAPAGPSEPAPQESLLQFSLNNILEDEGAEPRPSAPRAADQLDSRPSDSRHIRRVVLSVNDKWHYCHNSDVLVGSRAMRDRHLRLLGYVILQLPYQDLEKLNGIEEVKMYLQQKILDIPS
ncbi:fas-activated serine/threonine kinase [Synchiropus splendidus]|uniref:fas-activated serine/threonine kinase n=1 Tax=Synchiropus splendidus TaxID=270530 RepID=UPI00237E4DC6|nr:fas-activated serine/threonine kinase [Synchiropus splendidus]